MRYYASRELIGRERYSSMVCMGEGTESSLMTVLWMDWKRRSFENIYHTASQGILTCRERRRALVGESSKAKYELCTVCIRCGPKALQAVRANWSWQQMPPRLTCIAEEAWVRKLLLQPN